MVADAPLDEFHQWSVRYCVEVLAQVGIVHLAIPLVQELFEALDGIMGAAFGSKTVGAVFEVCFKDWLDDNLARHLNDAVTYHRYAQWPEFAIVLFKVEPLRSPQVILSCGSTLLWAHLTSPEPISNFTSRDYIETLSLSCSAQEVSYVYASTVRKHATTHHPVPPRRDCSRRYTTGSGRLPTCFGRVVNRGFRADEKKLGAFVQMKRALSENSEITVAAAGIGRYLQQQVSREYITRKLT